MIGEAAVKHTIFYDTDGNRLARDFGLLPITLYKGMVVTIHGHEGRFEVVDWSYHHGHEDEDAGLRIYLEPAQTELPGEPAVPVEWTWMKEIEPGLAELEAEIRAVEDDPSRSSFCASSIWYAKGGPKQKLQSLVGAHAQRVELQSGHSYDTAYDYLHELLPACRNCSCA